MFAEREARWDVPVTIPPSLARWAEVVDDHVSWGCWSKCVPASYPVCIPRGKDWIVEYEEAQAVGYTLGGDEGVRGGGDEFGC